MAFSLKQKKRRFWAVVNKLDLLENPQAYADALKRDYGLSPVLVSTKTREGIDKVREELIRLLPEDYEQESITGHLVSQGGLCASGNTSGYPSAKGLG